MSKRRLSTRPDLDFLKREAKELLSNYRREKIEAVKDFGTWHPSGVRPKEANLSDAQLVLARSYRFPSWARLKSATHLCRAIYDSDNETVRNLITHNPYLADEPARGMDTGASWGTPLGYARFLGRKSIFKSLVEISQKNEHEALEDAFNIGRRQLADWFLRPNGNVAPGAVMNPCETLNGEGLEFLLEKGATLADEGGNRFAPIAVILETYMRFPEGKHKCLDVCEQHGMTFPDTPVMALHRGRIDHLKRHLAFDPQLLHRRFEHKDIYPPELGCGPRSLMNGLHGTPIHGTTLLHIAIDFDEIEIIEWLVENGADVNAPAAIDADGFGGHTPLFGTVVSQPFSCGRQVNGEMAKWILQNGGNPHCKASLRKGIAFHGDTRVYEYRNVTALEFGSRFHSQTLVNTHAMDVITAFTKSTSA